MLLACRQRNGKMTQGKEGLSKVGTLISEGFWKNLNEPSKTIQPHGDVTLVDSCKLVQLIVDIEKYYIFVENS